MVVRKDSLSEHLAIKSTIEAHDMIDRRRHVRIPLRTKGLVKPVVSDSWLDCVLLDVSDMGSRILSTHQAQFQIDMDVVLQFRIGVDYKLPARVVWKDNFETEGQYQVGLQWLDMDDELSERLSWELMRLAVQRRRHR
jgi:c-di-GMP-binding flagellar brake protein YcgR